MANSVFPAQDGTVNVTDAASFIPEIWSDEVVASYETNLVLAPLTRKMSMVGKKGDTIHIPKPVRGSATAKAAGTAVTIQEHSDTQVDVVVNQHFEYSRMIEDIAEVQALSSMRQFYTSDAGYALAKNVDDNLFTQATAFGDGTYVAAPLATGASHVHSASFYNVSGVPTAYAINTVNGALAASEFTDAYFRAMLQKMDDADVPMDGRYLVVPPQTRNAIMGIDRYVSSDFVNGSAVVNGKIGSLYGVDIYVSTNCPVLPAASNTASAVDLRVGVLGHKDTIVLAEQKGVRSQVQYKQEFLGTLYTADRIYGSKTLRNESGFVMVLPG